MHSLDNELSGRRPSDDRPKYAPAISTFPPSLAVRCRQPSLYMGEASVYKAQLCAPTNDAHL